MLDATNAISDAIEIIKGTDVISDEKKFVMFQGIERLKRSHCRPNPDCLSCYNRRICENTIVDLLGS